MIQNTLAVLSLFFAFPLAAQPSLERPQAELPLMIQSQTANGSWRGDQAVGAVGVTSLQLLALIGDGNGLGKGEWMGAVQKAARWLLDQQDPKTGCIGVYDVAALKEENALLNHAWATYAISELAFGEKESPWQAGESARTLAVRALLLAQREDGSFGTARATGWAAFALVAARESGDPIDDTRLTATRDALQRLVSVEGDPAHLDGGKVALRCLIGFLVQGPTEAQSMDHEAITAIGELVQVPDLWDALDPESRMLVTFAAFQCGGETWKKANAGIKESVVPKQVLKGEGHGGFPSERGFGVTRATAFGVLVLSAYFRYARLVGMR